MMHEQHTKRRNAWMSHEGKDLYTGWMERLIDASRSQVCGYDLKAERKIYGEESRGRLNEINSFAGSMNNMYQRADSLLFDVRSEPLVEHFDDIGTYTSLEEFKDSHDDGDGANRGALRRQNSDSLRFAINVTLGLAHLAERRIAEHLHVAAPRYRYDEYAKVLRNPSFHATLEDFSFTGFGVHGERIAHAILGVDAEERMRDHYKLGEARVLEVSQDAQGDDAVYLSDPLRHYLRSKLKDQNTTGVQRVKATDIWSQAPVTAGCPVRRPVQGGRKSAIALLSEALAGQVEAHMITAHDSNSLALGGVSLRSSL